MTSRIIAQNESRTDEFPVCLCLNKEFYDYHISVLYKTGILYSQISQTWTQPLDNALMPLTTGLK